MEAIALTALIGGTTLSTISTLQAGSEAAKSGREAYRYSVLQKQAYDEEAARTIAQAEEESKAILFKGQYESREKRKEKERAKAARIAQVFAQGGSITGSKLKNIAGEAAEYEADASMIMHNAQLNATQTKYAGLLRATALRNRGQMALYEGQLAKYQGQMEKRASRIRATADIFQTLGLLALGAGGKKTGIGQGGRYGAKGFTTSPKFYAGNYMRNF